MTVLTAADSLRLGADAIDAVYAGSTKVWPPVPSTVEQFSIWGGEPPVWADGIGSFNDGVPISQATRFHVTEAGLVATHVRFWVPDDFPRTHGPLNDPTGRTLAGIYDSEGALLASGSRPPGLIPPGGLWVDIPLDAPLPLNVGVGYYAAAYAPGGEYVAAVGNHYFDDVGTIAELGAGPVVALLDETTNPDGTFRRNGAYVYGDAGEFPALRFPSNGFNGGCYFIDALVEAA